jgi:hypothetical protein
LPLSFMPLLRLNNPSWLWRDIANAVVRLGY